MKKYFKLFLLIIVVSISSLADNSLVDRIFFDNSVRVAIPMNFMESRPEFIEQKFPNEENRPKIIFNSPDGLAIISLNMVENKGDRQSIVHFFRDIKNDIRNNYPEHRFLKTDVIRNHSLAIVEVIFPNSEGKNMYNMMAFRYVGTKFFFFNFTCPEEESEKYQNLARDIAENISLFKTDSY
jgi:hypothetical protein